VKVDPQIKQPPPRRAERFYANFLIALGVLIALKVTLLVTIAPLSTLAKLPLLVGGDVLGAAVAALVVVVGRGSFWAASVQALHAGLAMFSTLCVAQLGGPITKQFVSMAAVQVTDWTAAVSASTHDYLGPGNSLLLLGSLVGGAALGATFRATQLPGRRSQTLLALSVLVTFLYVPFAQAGLLGPRIVTEGLDSSPWVELAGSYLRPAVRAALRSHDHAGPPAFRFNWSSVANPAATIATPLTHATPQRSNIVLILMESVGRQYIDHPDDPLPFLRSLQARPDVLSLDQHYATWALTTKALFSLLCSEMPYPGYQSVSYTDPAIPCAGLASTLKRAGWSTHFITSANLSYDRMEHFLAHQGFDRILDERTLPTPPGTWHSAWGVDESAAVHAVLATAAAEPGPFFVIYQQIAGHHPFIASAKQELTPSADRMGNYLRALRTADDAVRAVVDGLAARGRLDDTLVVVVADHGEGQGIHEGRNVYQQVVHVPALFVGPQTRAAAAGAGRVGDTTSMLDLAPTILGLVGVQVPCPMQGRDLTHVAQARLALFGGRPPRSQIGITDGSFKVIVEAGSPTMAFDLSVDPDETNDISASQARRTARYAKRIDGWTYQAAELIDGYADAVVRACP